MAVHQYHVQSTSNSCSKSQTDLLTDPMFNPVNVEAVSLLLSTLAQGFYSFRFMSPFW